MRVLDLLFESRFIWQNTEVIKYLRDRDFDFADHHGLIDSYLDDRGMSAAELFGKDVDIDDLMYSNELTLLISRLPSSRREDMKQYMVDWLERNDPASAPSWVNMALNDSRPLRFNWLVHFSNDADDIHERGFKYGARDVSRLGLTTWMSDNERKDFEGWNFAFRADSRDANIAAREGKYGSEAVLFMGSGVEVHHYGDEEHQVIFWGQHVKPSDMVYLRQSYGDWYVWTNSRWKENREYIFTGDFKSCVQWVMKNYRQYRRVLSPR